MFQVCDIYVRERCDKKLNKVYLEFLYFSKRELKVRLDTLNV